MDSERSRGGAGGSDTLTTLVDAVRGERPPSSVSDADARLVGRVLEGRYEILRPLDRGGMATVYVALDHRLDREVAVKVMHPSLAHDPAFVARFRREARAAASIRHPHVVAVTDAGEAAVGGDTVVFLVMELVRGTTLRGVLAERGRLTASQALEIIEAVLDALAAAHAAGLVHRDVKPENVLLGDDGRVEVADFGLARAVEASALTTHAGLLIGTVAYVAPEQVSHGRADARSDVYAAGVVLFEMLTGAVPYEAETPLAVAYKHVHEQVPPPSSRAPGVPSELDDLVLAATTTDPDERFPDAGAFLEAVRRVRRSPTLRSARGGDTRAIVLPPADPHGVTEVLERPAAPRGRRRRWPWVLVVVLLLSAVAAAAGWQLGRDARTHVPALTDRSLSAVEASLTADHLRYTVGDAVHSDTVPIREVVTTRPAPGAAVKKHSAVVIVPSSGVLQLTVPVVANQPQATAVAVLAQAGFPAPSVTTAYSDTVPTGDVVSANPQAGTTVSHRTRIALTVSKGRAPVTIPDVAKEPLATAQQQLAALGLKTTVTQAFSDTVASGTVISGTPSSGTGHRGDTIALTVSKGPQLVTVPDLHGDNGNQAAAALKTVGLVPHEDAALGIHGGTVLAQSPKAGSKVKPGTTVTYFTAY